MTLTTQHFLLTRFNIASPGRESAIRNAPGWLERRFALFEAYCLPSIAAQTTRDFNWLIYFDPATPEAFRERIGTAQQSFPFEARFVDSFSAEMVARDVVGRLDPDASRVLTTRLDNDDAVSRDFLERVRAAAGAHASGTVLNFPHGIALRQGRLFSANDPSNPFTTLIEDTSGPVQTIWSAQHRDLGTKWQLVQVASPPVWLQVVHGENVANRIKGALLDGADLSAMFAIAPEVPLVRCSSAELLADRLVAYPLRWLRERAIGLFKAVRDALRLRPQQ